MNSGTAFNAQIAVVNGSVFPVRDNFEADGKVSLMGAEIGADLDCQGGRFRNPSQEGVKSSGTALEINNATIKGNLLLHSGFVTEGTLNLMGTRIVGDLECHDTKFSMLVGHRMTVQRTFFWRNINNPEDATLYLKDVSVGSLADDTVSWPKEGSLFYLDGFTYGRIAGGPQNISNRLDWLSRQKEFTPQPYRQLAKILREEGDDPGARQVLYEMEKKKHQEGKHGWTARFWNSIFRGTIGYGIYPRRALWWLLVLIVMGWGVYWGGYFRGAITPTNKEAYEAFHSNGGPPRTINIFLP